MKGEAARLLPSQHPAYVSLNRGFSQGCMPSNGITSLCMAGSKLVHFPTFSVVSAARNPSSAGVRRVMPNTKH